MQKWAFSMQGPVLSSPAIGLDGTIYIGGTDRNFYALNPDGTVKWTFPAGGPVVGCPAVAEDGTIYFGGANTLFAVSPYGEALWSVPASAAIYGGVAIGARGMIYVGAVDGTLQAVKPDGTIAWQVSAGAGIASSPSVGKDGTIYFGAIDGNVHALYPSGQEKWQPFATGGNSVSSPAIGEDGTIYVGASTGRLYALNPDGTKKWESVRGGSVDSSAAISSAGTLYVGSSNGVLAALDAGSGFLKWEFLASSGIASSPAVAADGTVYFGCKNGNVYALNAGGRELWHLAIGSQILSSAAIGANGTVYIGANDRRLYAIAGSAEADTGPWPTDRGNLQRTGAVAGVPQDNMLPRVSGPAIVGTLVEGRPGSITVSCDAMDPDTGVQTVVADLTAIGGPAGQLLAKGAGDQWTWSGVVTPVNYGMQGISFTVADTEGATASISTSVRVMAVPRLTNLSMTGTPVRKQGGTVTISCTASDPDGTIQTVQADLTAIGGSATQALTKGAGDDWSWTGVVIPLTLGAKTISFQAADNDMLTTSETTTVTVGNAWPVITAQTVTGLLIQGRSCNVTVSCNASDPDGTVSSVAVNLTAIGGLIAQPLTLGAGNTWSWSGQVTPVNAGSVSVVFAATDNEGATTQASFAPTVHVAPVISNPDVTSAATIVSNLPATITASCQVTDAEAAIQSVVVDLSWLGGSSSQPLANNAGDTWTWTGGVFPTGVGDLVVTFVATDANGVVSTAQKIVRIVQNAPLVSDIRVTGVLNAGQSGTVTISCLAMGGRLLQPSRV